MCYAAYNKSGRPKQKLFFSFSEKNFDWIFLKKDDFSDLTVNEVCLALVQSFICHRPCVISNFLSLFVFKDSVHRIGQNFRGHGFVHGFVNFENPYQIPIHGG